MSREGNLVPWYFRLQFLLNLHKCVNFCAYVGNAMCKIRFQSPSFRILLKLPSTASVSVASVSMPSDNPQICGRPSKACIRASSDAVKGGGAGPPPVFGLLS